MAKSIYKGMVTVPDAATDSLADTVSNTIGGDLIKNDKSIADRVAVYTASQCSEIVVPVSQAGRYLLEIFNDVGYTVGVITLSGSNSCEWSLICTTSTTTGGYTVSGTYHRWSSDQLVLGLYDSAYSYVRLTPITGGNS